MTGINPGLFFCLEVADRIRPRGLQIDGHRSGERNSNGGQRRRAAKKEKEWRGEQGRKTGTFRRYSS